MLKPLNRKKIFAAACFTLLCMFCAHAFCYMNLSFSGGSVLIDVNRGKLDQTAAGQILAPFYWQLRGSLSSPMITGLLSSLYLLGCVLLIADLLGLSHRASLFMLCGTLTLHISVTAINASLLHVADAYFLALLFAVAGAYFCARSRLGFLPGALCFFLCLGLEPAMLPAALALLTVKAIAYAAKGAPLRPMLGRGVRALAALIAGAALYAAGLLFMLNRRGLTLNAWLHLPVGAGELTLAGCVEAWLAPIRQLLFPISAYAVLPGFLGSVLLLLGIAALAVLLRKCPAPNRIFAVIAALLLPFLLNFPVFSDVPSGTTSQTFSFCFLSVLIIALLDDAYACLPPLPARRLRRCIAGALGVVFLGSIVFSNQVYLKKNLEYQSTLSAMTRVIDRAERTEGFQPGFTPVAIVGSLEDSVLAVDRMGFEHLTALDAAANSFTASAPAENLWYFWEVMGYPFNFVSTAECDALSASEAVLQMPAFPESGCCQMIGDTLVIKLSDSL